METHFLHIRMENVYTVIDNLPFPRDDATSFANFIQLYNCFTPREWLLSDTLFEVANYIAKNRPELVDLGTRINVQVNLYLRTILTYHANPYEIIDQPNNIGCFALTEATDDGYVLNSGDTCKRWISQGMTAHHCLVMASNITNHRDCRIFHISLECPGVRRTRMEMVNLPISNTLDLAEIHFDNVRVNLSGVLEKTILLNRKQLLSGIFYGRLCISEAIMQTITGFVSMVFEKIKDIDKFKAIGHYQYIYQLNNELIGYCERMKERRNSLLESEDVMTINCYKVYCVETAIAIYNKIHMMFGTHAFGYGLDYQTLILNKVAEGDTSVLKLACIKQFVMERRLPIRYWYGLWRNPISYVMNNVDDIFGYIAETHIDVLKTI